MEKNTELIEVLNDLIQINNDRLTGYEKASKALSAADVDLKAIFTQMSAQSRKYTTELSAEVGRLGGEPSTSTTASGKIYRAWMDVKAVFTGKDRHAVLESCEYGEDAAQKAYDHALKTDAMLDTNTRQMIANQKSELRTSHDTIKKYRDMHEIVK
ncbi:MAG TPA: PA2169 family four-helix-bundle protein [Flavitalea sp.]|nr:PA2169 family four-helix-bundle protein [Flavitalea sp.]